MRHVDRVVKALNSDMKVPGWNLAHLCFFLEQETLLLLLPFTQVRMGTWPLVSLFCPIKIVKSPNRRMWRPMRYMFDTGWGINCVEALRAWLRRG